MNVDTPDNELVFADEPMTETKNLSPDKWKVLIVDDEEMVHNITEMALEGVEIEGKPLEFYNAFSGAEAKELFAEHNDFALVLLDVVMETDHAGLDVVKFIRDELKNRSTRIVLRTGQPGEAPERAVISEFDINDYKEKTELTSQKLYTLMHSTIRSYKDIRVIEKSRESLEQIINASADIFKTKSMQNFSQGVLNQLLLLLNSSQNSIYVSQIRDGIAASNDIGTEMEILAGTGIYEGIVGKKASEVLDKTVIQKLQQAKNSQKNIHIDEHYTGYFQSGTGMEKILYVENVHNISEFDYHLLELFCKNVSIAFDNINLKNEIEETQREIVYRLGEAVETRCRETGNHVKRVAEYSQILALGYGLSKEESEVIKLASPLHDVGKLGIPDAILNKPGKLTDEEWAVMQTHSMSGYDMLKSSTRRILKAASTIAREHHEKWDGGGYPHQLIKDKTHIYARIVTIADVFDALGNERPYKEAWPLEQILEYFKAEKGNHFDPDLVEIFLENLDAFKEIGKKFKDAGSSLS